MRRSLERLVTALVIAVLIAACGSPRSSEPAKVPPPSGTPASSAPATPEPSGSTPASSEAPSVNPPPGTGSLPVHGNARDLALGVLTAPGPAGSLYVSIPEADGTVLVALLDPNGRPRAGWPIELAGATRCPLLLPVDDGSVRLVCAPEALNQELNSGMRAYALDANGGSLPGWPVDLDGSFIGRMVGDQLTLLGQQMVDVCEAGQACGEAALVTVASAGTVRHGVGVPLFGDCCAGDMSIGPDGVAYGVTWTSGLEQTPEVTRIRAIGLSGVQPGWPVRIDGTASGPAFRPDGQIVLTVGSYERDASQVLILNRNGRVVSPSAPMLPIATAQTGVDCIAGAPEPPLVAQDGTIIVFSEIDRAVFAISPARTVLPGWPYRPPSSLEHPGASDPRNELSCAPIARPAVGPDGVVYLPLSAGSEKIGGSIVAVGQNGRVRPGWPVELQRAGAEFWSVVIGADGTAFALAMEPEPGNHSSATILAIAPDSTVLYRTTIVDP